jgi:hypothetical protein
VNKVNKILIHHTFILMKLQLKKSNKTNLQFDKKTKTKAKTFIGGAGDLGRWSGIGR